MGWTFTHKEPGVKVVDFFREEFEYDKPTEGRSWKVLDCAAYTSVAYLAMERVEGDKRKVYAEVCLLRYRPRDEYNFGYKDMSEVMRPYRAGCPERILKLLTPTDSEGANEWRAECWENIGKAKERAGLKPGTVVEFSEPILFRNGNSFTIFRAADPKRGIFEAYWEVLKEFASGYKLGRSVFTQYAWRVVPDLRKDAEAVSTPA
jgi:hypothetical protein